MDLGDRDPASPARWTLEQRDYTDRAIRELRDDIEKAVALARHSRAGELTAALESMNRRLAELNDFRRAFSDRERDFPSREVVEGMTGTLEIRIEALRQERQTAVAAVEVRLRAVEAFVSNIRGRLAVTAGGLGLLVIVVNVILYLISRH